MPKTPAKPLSPDQVLDKIAKYCAYQERCVKDVKDKLKTYDIAEEEKNNSLIYSSMPDICPPIIFMNSP